MKKILISALIFCMLCPLLSACNIAANITQFMYDNEELYTVGEATLTDSISKIDIDWISGSIDIVYHDSDTVRFTEKPNKDVGDDMIMRYYFDGETLKIKFSASGKWNYKNIKKDLTVYLPVGLALENIEIDTSDSSVELKEITAEDASVEIISGGVKLDNCNITDELNIESVSAYVDVTINETDKLSIETVSAKMRITVNKLNELDIDTTSGSIELTSYDLTDKADIDTVSGGVKLYISQDRGYAFEIDTVSGKIESDIAWVKDGDKYLINGGGSVYKIDSVSGSVNIYPTVEAQA